MLDFLKELTNPESIIKYGGLALLLIVIFAETGLFIGFFLPGDSLVFIAGLFCATQPELLGLNIAVLLSSMITAAVVGNIAGYIFGYKVGPSLFKRDDSWIFKKRYVEITRAFYKRHGGLALVLGRFLPIIRTFAPILAGVIKVDFKKFMLYNIAGAIAWISSIGLVGYVLGKKVPWIKDELEYIVIGLIIITAIPVVVAYGKQKNNGS